MKYEHHLGNTFSLEEEIPPEEETGSNEEKDEAKGVYRSQPKVIRYVIKFCRTKDST